ncbi:hypothetical protein [Paraburkholderia phytofirmans]|uniref:Uncharacterized protein n=2 Tax=Paraburkholderia phytofirmans TaxID=261302 RepID=B2TG18_PARPJ|nr:hypothetical protein [Paraburkholderia phytofirmans]ACD19892.1 hypothetical protein Bphyt_5537 [Paraburkholderia phytofirmans PsJN]
MQSALVTTRVGTQRFYAAAKSSAQRVIAVRSTSVNVGARRACSCRDVVDSIPRRTWPQTPGEVLRECNVVPLLAASIYSLVGDILEALTVLACVVAIVLISVFQSRRTARALDSLRELWAPRAQGLRDGQICVLFACLKPQPVDHAKQKIDIGTSSIVYRVVSAGVQKENRRAYVGYVEVVTVASDRAVRADVLRCEQVRPTATLAYADAIGLKKRLELSEIGDANAFGQSADGPP